MHLLEREKETKPQKLVQDVQHGGSVTVIIRIRWWLQELSAAKYWCENDQEGVSRSDSC